MAAAEPLLESRRIDDEQRVVGVDARERPRAADHLDGGLGVRHLDRRGGPLTLHEQDGERPAPPAEPSHHLAERFVGERVIPERGTDDRRRVDPDHVEALRRPAGANRRTSTGSLG